MKFTVPWTGDTERDLAAIWVEAADRGAVTAAVDAFDRALGRDPESQGESRDGDIRVMFEPPLGIDFKVLPDDRIVYVVPVWRTE